MELTVLNTSGQETGRKVKLNSDVFAITPNDHAIYLDVKQILANRRQGTHKAKERAEVNYSTRKLKRQKGTGGARAGSIKSPVFVGGGRIFGPKPRDYSFRLNKKVKMLARKSALTYKAQDNGIVLVEQFQIEKPSTKQYSTILKNLNLSTGKTLVVIPENNQALYLSSRNLPNSKVVTATDLNTYDILHANHIVLFEDAVKNVENTLTQN
ncbi:MAG: 50S ribosomal protein L4 [Bacteroidia bacterium]|jgi:large subunit ribosomal protein L4|nr:50S ribosomal protein L4 [Bacteroidia bacterium]MCC6769234.1 50S ribosomal protein L4 [Bacteroidia bacterium]